jgi:hypothetical protein
LLLSLGYSPLFVRPQSLVAYWPLIGRNSPELELIGGQGGTLTGTTQAEHPRIIRPKRRQPFGITATAPPPPAPTLRIVQSALRW